MVKESELVPTVAVLVYKNDNVLLVKHEEGASHLTGVYGLPSGRINENESEDDAAVRELKEETGLQTAKEDLVEFPNNLYYASIPRKGGEIINFSWRVFIAKQFWGNLVGSSEATPEWVRIDELDKYNLLPNVNRVVTDGLKFLQINSKL